MQMRYLLFLIAFVPTLLQAQDNPKILTQEQLIWFIENYHPVAAQGKLILNQGESTVRKAQGNFDPYVQSSLDQKYFDQKDYYSILNAGLKIPTWYGIELKTGYNQNNGDYLNPENTVPQNGLWYAGVSVTLGQGLFIDKRRATLKQAQIFAESTLAERQKLMNDLYFDAIKQYWKWIEAWNQYLVYEESVELAKTRLNAIKRSFVFGDKPAIDTLEAFIQVQNRQFNRNQSLLNYQNTTLELSNFLWYENNTPLEISDSLRPPTFNELNNNLESLNADELQNLVGELAETHPDMQLYNYKLGSMEIERRLKAEGLKPTLNLNYNALNEPTGSDFFNNYSIENYKWGVEFSIPLFLRKERGDLQLTKFKIQETEYGQQQKLVELQNKVRSYYNEQKNLQDQVKLFTDAVNNYNLLLKGEIQKFNSGESSLFLINSREINLINARIKLIEITTNYNIASTGLTWATGKLF